MFDVPKPTTPPAAPPPVAEAPKLTANEAQKSAKVRERRKNKSGTRIDLKLNKPSSSGLNTGGL
jgi:hypothetical protein